MKHKLCSAFAAAALLHGAYALAGDKHAAHSHGLGQLELVVQGGTVKASF